MRIGFDLDGTITSVENLPILNKEYYDKLGPYDKDTVRVWNDLCTKHQVYIITARFYAEDAWQHIREWLVSLGMEIPTGVITHTNPTDKFELAEELKLRHFFDDHPLLHQKSSGMVIPRCQYWLMNNPNWVANQQYNAGKARITSWKEIKQIIDATENN